MLKKINILLIISISFSFAQREASIKIDQMRSGDGRLYFDISVKKDAGPLYEMGLSDFIFSYNPLTLKDPKFEYRNSAFSGIDNSHNGGTNFDDYRKMSLFPIGDDKLNLQIYFVGNGSGKASPFSDSYEKIATLSMAIVDFDEKVNFVWDELGSRLSHSQLTAPVTNHWMIEVEKVELTEAPNPPTQLTILPGENQIAIKWQDNSATEAGYIVERKTTGSSNWVQVADLPADTKEYFDTEVVEGEVYEYRLLVYSEKGTVVGADVVEDSLEPSMAIFYNHMGITTFSNYARITIFDQKGVPVLQGKGDEFSLDKLPKGKFEMILIDFKGKRTQHRILMNKGF